MATQNFLFSRLKAMTSLFILAFMVGCAASAEAPPEDTAVPVLPDSTPPLVGPAAPGAAATGAAAGATAAGAAAIGAAATGAAAIGAAATGAAAIGAAATGAAAIGAAATGAAAGTAAAAGAGAAAAGAAAASDAKGDLHPLTFFMHDIIGGSNPTAVSVTGIVANPTLSGQVPFAKPNGANLAINTGIPQDNSNNGIISNNNVPFLSGLNGVPGNVIQNNGVNLIGGGSGFPILNGGNLPQGMTLQKLMFGTLTVFDDELTEGVEPGSAVLGKAQGYYVASSEEGTSQTMALTAMFAEGGFVDSISFFGVHRTVVSESHLAIMGGTGKYVNARGYATIKLLPAPKQQNIDGSETLIEFNVYLA